MINSKNREARVKACEGTNESRDLVIGVSEELQLQDLDRKKNCKKFVRSRIFVNRSVDSKGRLKRWVVD